MDLPSPCDMCFEFELCMQFEDYAPEGPDFDVTAWKEPILPVIRAMGLVRRRMSRRRETKGNRGHFNFKKM